MNISEIHVEDFGAWHNLQLDQLGPGATVFYGCNEAGKTTVLNLIRTVFYGFSAKRCQKYLPPAHGSVAGGAVKVLGVNGEYQIRRTASARYEGGAGELRVSSAQGDSHGGAFLQTLLNGVDETIFNNVFAVGLTQMQELSTLSDTEAAEQLYGLATGVDRVSLHDVVRAIERQRKELLPDDPSLSRGLQQLCEQRDRLQKELKALRRDEGHWNRQRQTYRELTQQIRRREKEQSALEHGEQWPELSAKVREQWGTCRQLNDRLTRVGPLIDLPKHVVSRVQELTQQIAQRRSEWEQLRDQRRRIKARAQKSKGLHTLYRHAAEIEALDRQRHRVLSLEEESRNGQSQLEELRFEMQAELEQLGLQAGTSTSRMPNISDKVIEALREPARATRELRDRVDAAKKLADRAREEAKSVKGKLETAALRFGGEELDAALQRSRKLVERLERRLELDEDREGIVRQLDHAQEEAKYWQSRSVMPWSGILTICGVFSAGVALLLGGMLNHWFDFDDSVRLPMMMIGGSFALVSLVIKGTFENSALERATLCERQVEGLLHQQETSQEESSELDRTLPTGASTLDQRVIAARREFQELQQFLPLQHRYEELTHEANAAEHHATLAIRELKESRRAWKASLRAVGLPDTLTPAQIGEMTGRVGDVTRLRERSDQLARQLEERQQELNTIRDRIQQLWALAELDTIPDGLGPQLDRLLVELKKHMRSGKESDGHRHQWEQLRQKQQRVSATAQQLIDARRQLLHAHGLASKGEFLSTLAQVKKSSQMRARRNQLLGKISGTVGGEFTVARLQKLLDRRSNELLQHLAETDSNQQSVGEDLDQLRRRADELRLRLEAQVQDRRADRKELAIRVLEERIQRGLQRWHILAMASASLDAVKQNYETKRQPVALAEASRFLEQLTEGRYTRIWTPMGQSSLCVDGQGKTLPVEKLSRGTRELIFLSLRLALVASYKRRGASMPMVLDDVFVNFDDQRAAAVAAVLANVASDGQQLLVFTCHQRIRGVFSELGCDVRDLPLRDGLSAKMVPPPTAVVQETKTMEPEVASPLPVEEPIETKPSALPVYDPESWEETLHSLAIPELPDVGVQTDEPVLQDVLNDITDEIVMENPAGDMADDAAGRFKPAWRDEWLEPLPDLEPHDSTKWDETSS